MDLYNDITPQWHNIFLSNIRWVLSNWWRYTVNWLKIKDEESVHTDVIIDGDWKLLLLPTLREQQMPFNLKNVFNDFFIK